ncbi:hypothetical protein Lal_00041246 [Lupinus albus]|uniref:Putative transcription factor bHLH family n=1 Tax=Lupinus albus TaxID=3870 RepID=A0A6A5NZZ4_LUPAL|nr:putative transcription factor bHLH family [Lupinus albus]KAF1890488.1 hypothetical protein Lal_00041246 [Lupinus albus]
MEYGVEDWLCGDIEESENGRMGRKREYNDEIREYKSKNLETERRRREKLSTRLLMLRSLMNKATIIDDATTYIKELQSKVESLTQELHQMEATYSDEKTVKNVDEVEVAEDINKWEIQAYYSLNLRGVRLAQIDTNKLWVKIIIENKRGSFKKLMEGMNILGFELLDTNLIKTKGALFIEGCMQVTLGKGADGERLSVHQIKKYLQDIISEK